MLTSLDFSDMQVACSIEMVPAGVQLNSHGFILTENAILDKNSGKELGFIAREEIAYGDKIGTGTGGEVYAAVHEKTQLPLAIKLLGIQDKLQRKQLSNEINLGLKAQNRHIVTVFGGYYSQDFVHLVMEYMDLGSLRAFLDIVKEMSSEVPLIPEPFIATMLGQILGGLHYLHEHKSLHRDVKPGNVLTNSLGEVKISDFGISKIIQETLARTFVGTSRYMAPERIKHEIYDTPCDIWGLGMILYEMATGALPYADAASSFSMQNLILEGSVPELPAQDRLSPGLIDFYNSCVDIDPKKRATTDQLLKHPWMTENYLTDKKEYAEWIALVDHNMRETKLKNKSNSTEAQLERLGLVMK